MKRTERPSARERNRRSILDAAQAVLRENPDASLDEVAARAGVVRRTLYGHFTSRHDLVVALVRAASADFVEKVGEVDPDAADPAVEFAAALLRTWSTSRRYGPVIALARRTADDEVRAAMGPFHTIMIRLLKNGQRAGVFSRHAAAPVLAEVLQAGSLAYMRAAQEGRWDGDETDVALGHLLTLGMPEADARAAVARATS